MRFKFLSLNSEQGDASIVLAMVMAVGLGTAVYYNMDKLNQTFKVNKVIVQKERAETRNISGLSQATALMQYNGASPASNQASTLPYIFPDPYITGNSIGTTRTVPNAPTWSFSQMKLEINSPSDAGLKGADFTSYVSQDVRPKFNSKATIKFLNPVKSDGAHPNLITKYDAEVTTPTFDGQNLVSRATVDVPKPMPPICTLTSANGNTKFQPNTPMRLVLSVSGVAETAWIPDQTEELDRDPGELQGFLKVDLKDRANSIRKINNTVYTWTVPSPRPLMAVDGAADVQITAYAYLTPVDNNSNSAVSCSFTFWVTPPATCKLWTDKASVPPGQCVNITSATVGPVVANSLKLAAVDATDAPIKGLTQTSSTGGTFCTPAVTKYNTSGPAVSKPDATLFSTALANFTPDQKKSLLNQLNALVQDLQKLFGKTPELQNLSIYQYNDLFNLADSDLKSLDIFDFSKTKYLSTLTADQVKAMRGLKDKDFKDLSSMKPIYLKQVNLLDTVPDSILDELSGYDPVMLASFIGSSLDTAAATAANANPVDYKVVGSIKANDGTTNSCIVHVTAGTNKCAYFGSQYPNYKTTETLSGNWHGQQIQGSFDFSPANPSWEVASIATSPTNVKACPPSARCFAVGSFGNRTPFVVVDPADSASCDATVNLRIDLGCFDASTKIRMADGTDKEIKLLEEQDRVLNPITQKSVAIKRVTRGPEKNPLLSIQTADGLVKVTSKHPFMSLAGLKQADELQVGDKIKDSKGNLQSILAIQRDSEAPKEWVWNFEIDTDSKDASDHAILANGIVTGDLYLQEHLARQKAGYLTLLNP